MYDGIAVGIAVLLVSVLFMPITAATESTSIGDSVSISVVRANQDDGPSGEFSFLPYALVITITLILISIAMKIKNRRNLDEI